MDYENPKTSLKLTVLKWFTALALIGSICAGFLGYLNPVLEFLDKPQFHFKIGSYEFSASHILKKAFIIFALFWIATVLNAMGRKNIRKMQRLKASDRALLANGLQIFIFSFIFIIGLDLLGINMTSFAVIGGAIAVGIGFGLQKITSNFISGLILLFEKSVEEGDLIELNDGTVGFVRNTGARYTLVETFDSKDIMIPNEDFITNRVVNWTFKNSSARVDARITVGFDTDVEFVRDLILKTAKAHPRSASTPDVQCHLDAFGENGLNFILYFWVADVTLGRMDVKSDILRAIWQEFKIHNITIPYPQRAVHMNPKQAIKS